MKSYCLELAGKQKSYNAKLNIMREYLQAYILKILQKEEVLGKLCFLGGTALRFLYGLRRFSEDLDFSLGCGKKLSLLQAAKKIKQELILAGYEVSLTYNDKKNVQYAFVKFSSLMYEAGISPLKKQKFSLKIEVDMHPPKGAKTKTVVINKYFPLAILSYSLPSLFSGKIHAILSRRYTKGRDFFDIGWYLSKWPDIEPNIALLRNSLKQTGYKNSLPAKDTWRRILYQRVEKVDWNKVRSDVKAFLEDEGDLKVFTQRNVLSLIKRSNVLTFKRI